MIRVRTLLLIILAAAAIGLLMGYRSGLPFGWQRALVAAIAFVILGGLVSYFSARRRLP